MCFGGDEVEESYANKQLRKQGMRDLKNVEQNYEPMMEEYRDQILSGKYRDAEIAHGTGATNADAMAQEAAAYQQVAQNVATSGLGFSGTAGGQAAAEAVVQTGESNSLRGAANVHAGAQMDHANAASGYRDTTKGFGDINMSNLARTAQLEHKMDMFQQGQDTQNRQAIGKAVGGAITKVGVAGYNEYGRMNDGAIPTSELSPFGQFGRGLRGGGSGDSAFGRAGQSVGNWASNTFYDDNGQFGF